jgi:hypothetical protein
MAEEQVEKVDMAKYEPFMKEVTDRLGAHQAAERAWREERRPAFEAAAASGERAPDWAQPRELKPAPEMTNKEIVLEARELHSQFQQLTGKYEQAPATQRAEIREEMTPLVNRENELRQEFTGRLNPEMKQDRVPEQQISHGY